METSLFVHCILQHTSEIMRGENFDNHKVGNFLSRVGWAGTSSVRAPKTRTVKDPKRLICLITGFAVYIPYNNAHVCEF